MTLGSENLSNATGNAVCENCFDLWSICTSFPYPTKVNGKWQFQKHKG